ncbi:MgtC/SapB family protein [Sphingomonas parva]|uniref:MgtC/SapB family protein n=1 Tax=Sphingomonas parva TaxID=2555898 RepID=UPI001CDD2149|nr:MgtC/SapB family protein [Sphingomonas parva]
MTSFEDILLRLGCATVVGLLLGLDREIRGVSAGLRTHALVGLSAAAITLSALVLHDTLDADGQTRTDPLRVVQGLAQAIGFIAAGLIFVSRDQVRNVTSAANIWLTTAVGIAAGAGQFAIVLATTVFGIVIVTVVRLGERYLPRVDADAD